MKRLYRVRENKRFQEIRRSGRSYTNELLVLCALPNCLPYSRFGFSVSSRIGNAVARNRIKRRLREAVRLRMDEIATGWDVVFIARNPIRTADYHVMEAACARLLRRAHLLNDGDAASTTNSPATDSPARPAGYPADQQSPTKNSPARRPGRRQRKQGERQAGGQGNSQPPQSEAAAKPGLMVESSQPDDIAGSSVGMVGAEYSAQGDSQRDSQQAAQAEPALLDIHMDTYQVDRTTCKP